MLIAPSFDYIPLTMLRAAVTGALFAKIAQASMPQWIKVSVITALAEDVLYLSIIQMARQKTHRKFTHLVIHTFVSTVEILALRRLNLIAERGTFVVSLIAIISCAILSQYDEKSYQNVPASSEKVTASMLQ